MRSRTALYRLVAIIAKLLSADDKGFPQRVLSSMTAGASNLAELNRVLNSTVMVRRLKSEVLDQLPPKRRQHVSHLGSALCPGLCVLSQNY